MSNKNEKNDPTLVPSPGSELDNKIAHAVGAAIEKALPMAVMAAARAAPQPQQQARPAPTHLGERCHKCGQYVVACKDEHVKMYVGPKSGRLHKDFPGCILGGIIYRSPRPGAAIIVPRENDFRYMVFQWENGEENLKTGRTTEHNSGTLSGKPGHTKINPANPYGMNGNMPS